MKIFNTYNFLIRMVCIVSFALFALQFVACKDNAATVSKKTINDIKEFRIPIYPTAKNIEENFYSKFILKSTTYEVNSYYPASRVIDFYDKEMKKSKFVPYVEEHLKEYDRTWQTYIDGTKKGEPDVASLTINWADEDKTKRATLVMRYYWFNNKSKKIYFNENKNLNVEFRIKPFFIEPPPPR